MNIQQTPPTAYKSDTFQIEPKIGSKKLIIFFSATGAKPGRFHFIKEGMNLPCHRIFINNGFNEWYQAGVPGFGDSVEKTTATMRRWADHLGASEIYTCGGSMGGYAAILYGCLLNARVLSFAAETTLGIEGSRSVSHIREKTQLHYPELFDLISKTKSPVFHYAGEADPIDIYCASKIIGASNLTVTTIRGIDHAPPRYIRDVGLLPAFLQRLLANEDMPTIPDIGMVLNKSGFPELYLRTFQAFKRKEWDDAIRKGRSALEILPTSDFCHYLVGASLMKLSRSGEALVHVATANALGYEHTEHREDVTVKLADCIRQTGDPAHAVHIYQTIIERNPKCAPAHYGLGLSLLATENKVQARIAFLKAAELKPEKAAYAARVGRSPFCVA